LTGLLFHTPSAHVFEPEEERWPFRQQMKRVEVTSSTQYEAYAGPVRHSS
jgi:hypothetical protein